MHIDFLVAHTPLHFLGVVPWRIQRHKAAEQLRLTQGASHERAWWLTVRTAG